MIRGTSMRVLLVEDDMVVAGCLGPIVAEAGHRVVGLAADRDTAIALLRSTQIDLALVDLRLADGWTGADVARAADEEGVPVVITTGNRDSLPVDFAGALGVLLKPYVDDDIQSVLGYVARVVSKRATQEAAPSHLELSPRWANEPAGRRAARESGPSAIRA